MSEGDGSSRGGRAARLAEVAFGVAVIGFGGWFVASRWDQVQDALEQARPAWVVLAAAFAVVGQWAAALGFRAVLTATSRALPVRAVFRVYFVSQLGKYVPGAVWPIVALMQMGRRYGVSRSAAAVTGALAMVFSVAVGGMIGVVLVLIAASGSAAGLWWLLLLVPLAVALVHPKVIGPVVNALLRLARRPPIDLALRGPALWGAVGWPVVSWLLLGLQCWALVVSLGGPALGSLIGAIGGFALAYVAGTVAVFAPGGLGVREAVLGVALAGIIGSASFDHGRVIAVVLVSRVLLAVLDFAQAGGWSLAARADLRADAARPAAAPVDG